MDNAYHVKTAIALIVYKRPDKTRKVLEALSKVVCGRVYVIADGPKNERERESVYNVREMIETKLSGNVYNIYSENNMGSRQRVVSGLNHAFQYEDELIVIEDDIIPTPAFFEFCDNMLERYRKDERVFMVSGRNHLGSYGDGDNSYIFTLEAYTWGWATWRRAWEMYDSTLKIYENRVSKRRFNQSLKEMKYLRISIKRGVRKALQNRLDAWDYQWNYAMICNEGLCIVPVVNMIRNDGFGEDATHTKNESSALSQVYVGELYPPYRHNVDMKNNLYYYDEVVRRVYKWNRVMLMKSWWREIKSTIKYWLKSLFS